MPEKSSGKEAEKATEPISAASLSIPIAASIQDILRAIKILSDSGGQARYGDISTSFGTKPSEKNLLGWALNSGVAFGLISPHKKKMPYVLSEDGTKLLSLSEEEQKALVLPKFLGFEGYRKILVTMKNSENSQLKKQTITEIWSQIRDNLKLGTRQNFTFTFASVGVWCGALIDSGQTCSLTSDAQTMLAQILGTAEGKKIEHMLPQTLTPASLATTGLSPTVSGFSCPHCGKTEVAIENEELLQTLSSADVHTLIIRSTYYCRGCSRTFSSISQRPVKMGD
jgi:hypothetical protein